MKMGESMPSMDGDFERCDFEGRLLKMTAKPAHPLDVKMRTKII